MSETVEIEKARDLPGLRLVITAGVPGPWGEAAKGLFHCKDIPFARVAQGGGLSNDELVAWTGQSNAPQAIYENEPELKEAGALFRTFAPKNMSRRQGIAYHPGAKKFYKEAGIWKR